MSMSGIKMPELLKQKIDWVKDNTQIARAKNFGAVFFQLNDTNTTIVETGDLPKDYAFEDFLQKLKDTPCSWAVASVPYTVDNGSKKSSTYAIQWINECAPLKKKMVMASSWTMVKAKCEAQKYLQINDISDLQFDGMKEILAEKEGYSVREITHIGDGCA